MGEGHRRLFNSLSRILMGAGLAICAWGVWLAWQPMAVDALPAERPPELNPPRLLETTRPSSTLAETARSTPVQTRRPSPEAASEAELPLRLSIPAIHLEAPVVPVGLTSMQEEGREFITWEPPNRFAAGWLTTSAHPGRPGNIVLIGHHNIYGKVFADLHRLRLGDQIQLETWRRVYIYKVEALHILPEKGQPLEIRQRNLRWILPTSDERLTLVTCWPPNNNTHRLIVVARPANSRDEPSGR
ncbi:sortase [Thermoflexus sp.]|uniref:sortase n=1 Tax=Thermoflexus sp. TaxID=1969742 RepID=UPI0035E402CF